MKAPISENIAQILRENKYENWIFRTEILPIIFKKRGVPLEVYLNNTELKYYIGKYDVTEKINTLLDRSIGKSIPRKHALDINLP